MLKGEVLASIAAAFAVDEVKHLEHAPPASSCLRIADITKSTAVIEPGDHPENRKERELQRAKVANVCWSKPGFLNYPKTPSLSAAYTCNQVLPDTYLNHGKESRCCSKP